MNANEIVRALKNDAKWVEKISWANALTPGSAEFLAVSERITGAADLIDKLQALAENGQSAIDTNMRLVKVVESLQAQLAESQRRAQDARNELCQKCGRYREAHSGACDGCRWKENFKMLNAEKDRSYLLKHYGHNFPAHAKYVRKPNRIYFATDFDDGEKITFAWMCDQPSSNAHGNATYHSPAKGFRLLNIHDIVPDMEAECAGCENWGGSDCTLVAPDAGCPYA